MTATKEKQVLPHRLLGAVASSGIGRGRALLCDCSKGAVVVRKQVSKEQAPAEMARFEAAVAVAEKKLRTLENKVEESLEGGEAAIFQTQILLLRDVQLHDAVRKICFEEGMNAEAAVEDAVGHLSAMFDRLADPYFRERAADLNDVGKRLLNHLAEESQPAPTKAPQDSVIVTRDLLSSVVAGLGDDGVRGFIVEKGGLTAHATILARALGIPMLVHVAEATKRIRPGDAVIVDALAGQAFINPRPAIVDKYDRLVGDLASRRKALESLIDLPAATVDGVAIKLSANIGQSTDAFAAANVRADGCGLYRTEFVFSSQDRFPTEEEQYQDYLTTADSLQPGETVIRILDIGSDKSLSYLPLPRETNPALGMRGTRLLLEQPDLLRIQLRAILRLSASHPVAILLPMIGGLEELRAIKEIIEMVKAELLSEGIGINPRTPLGVMIETPAAVILIEALADEVDFLNIGTNDLVQYLLVADRLSDRFDSACNPFHPAVIRTLASLSEKANAKGIPICLCGEIAGDPFFTSLLIGLGYRSFSLSPGRILDIKQEIRTVRVSDAKLLATKALSMRTTREVKTLVNQNVKRRSS